MKIYSYSELKKRYREERDAYPQPLALRVHRALSWLDCSERTKDLDGKFIFLWIAFNAAYAAERQGEEKEYESNRFNCFLRQMVPKEKRATEITEQMAH